MRDLVAQYLEQHSDRTSLITITRVDLIHNAKLARCYISVFPREKEEAALGFATRSLSDLRAFIASKTKTKFIPSFEFIIDEGEKNRQRIDELLRK